MSYGIRYENLHIPFTQGIKESITMSLFTFNRRLSVTHSDFFGNINGIFNSNANNFMALLDEYLRGNARVNTTA